MRKYALNIAEDKRILSATYEEYATAEMPIVETLPEGNIADYLYIDGEYVYEPLPEPEPVEPEPTEVEVLQDEVTALQLALCDQYEENLALQEEVTNTQLALVELYEGGLV